MGPDADNEAARATAWLSRGFEALLGGIDARRASGAAFDFDVLIVGSGYGGAVALSRLADCVDADGRPPRICLLERGEEYLPGAFPSRLADLAGHVRFSTPGGVRPRGIASGLFDVRVGDDVHALLANGLGGGSLINAGVMAMPNAGVFEDPRWPSAIRKARMQLIADGQAMADELGATPHASSAAAKRAAMARMAAALDPHIPAIAPLPITVAADDAANRQRVYKHACIACGDCATGCNHGAKQSLDVTLLAGARGRSHVEVYTGATVLRVQPLAGGGWDVEAVHTHPHRRRREPGSAHLLARRVILAAGTFGSTEILLRSRSEEFTLSPLLGQRFSANGDAMTTLYAADAQIGAVADEREHARARDVGPTIQTCIRARTDGGARRSVDPQRDDPDRDFVIQDITVPAPLRRAFEEITLTAHALDALGTPDLRVHGTGAAHDDPNAVDREKIRRSLLVATIGHDDADGRIELTTAGDGELDLQGDGAVTVRWPGLRADPRFAARHAVLERAVAGIGATALANPMWRAMPQRMSSLLDAPLGPLITVHPLGGCPMGEDGGTGVVDHAGRVFRGATTQHHDGLAVLDGSIVPMSLGINPALTIATLAAQAMPALCEDWGLRPGPPHPLEAVERPRYRDAPEAASVASTMVTISERLCGRLPLTIDGAPLPCRIALELRSLPVALDALMSAQAAARRIELDPETSRLRIYADADAALQEPPLAVARVGGALQLLGHASTTPRERRCRGLHAWLWNRGFRDMAQYAMAWLEGAAGSAPQPGLASALATRAGDARTLDYTLTLEPLAGDARWRDVLSGRISGTKSLTYAVAANPWTQLQQVALHAFPAWQRVPGEAAMLEVDLTYFERSKSMLLDIVDQQDMPTALADLASFGLYLARTMLHVHAWTFRKPDPAPGAVAQRLPGHLAHHAPRIFEFLVREAPLADGTPVQARLTRYRGAHADPALPPVLMIHGYSASGTTFAHAAIPDGGLAGHLADRGHDAWVLDLRSSCGMPTAREPWSFEEVGYADIPLAVDKVLQATGHTQIDVVAHCMGAAMLSMALFGAYPASASKVDPQLALRRLLPDRIRRLVLSQVGPALEMAPANVARAYLLRYMQQYLPLERFQFRPADRPGPGEAMLDRLLAGVPYPRDEFLIENPRWPPGRRTPWAAIRHRMDALYGMTFKLANMPDAVLARLDDFFGPMNARTTSQVIHFTRGQVITDAHGRACYTDPDIVRDRLRFPVLSLHSTDNGLVAFDTLQAMRRFLSLHADGQYRSVPLPGYGHQDALIGRGAADVFGKIGEFLRGTPMPDATREWPIVAAPAIVLRRRVANGALHATVRWMEYLGTPFAAALVPVLPVQAPAQCEPIAGTPSPPCDLPPLALPPGTTRAVLLLLFRRPVRIDPAQPGDDQPTRMQRAISRYLHDQPVGPHDNGVVEP